MGLVVLSVVAVLGVFAFIGARRFLLRDSPPPAVPALSAAVRRGTIQVGDRLRSYLFYVPATLHPHPALLLALHAARGSGRRMRVETAYEFDQLADTHNFVVVYPDAVGGYWNDCRRAHSARARIRKRIDDVGFLRALIQRFRSTFNFPSSRVLVMGFSNGGQMAYRLALEAPDAIAAIAVVEANLPTPDNSICKAAAQPLPVMIVAGTADPVSPYGGGVGWWGFGHGGPVQSALASAHYFAKLAGDTGAPTIVRYPEADHDPDTWVERASWQHPGRPPVMLYTVHGGGHSIPQAKYTMRRLLGPTDADIDCMHEIWRFFHDCLRHSDDTESSARSS